MLERRNSARQKTLFRGVVYFDSASCATECMIRDLSESGARLTFSAPQFAVSELLELQIPLKAFREKCKIVRRSDAELGVVFLRNIESEVIDDAPIADRMSRLEAEIAALKQVIEKLHTGNKNIVDAA